MYNNSDRKEAKDLARRDGPVTGFLKRIREGADQAWDEAQRIRREDPVIAPAATALKGAVKTAAETSLAVADVVAVKVGKGLEKFAGGFEGVFEGQTGEKSSRQNEGLIRERISQAFTQSETLFEICYVPASSPVRAHFRGTIHSMRDIIEQGYIGSRREDDKIAAVKSLFNGPFALEISDWRLEPNEIDWRNKVMHDIWFPLLKEIGGLSSETIDTIERVLVAS